MATAETMQRVFKMLTRCYPDHAQKHLAGAEAVETMRLYQRLLEDIPDDVLETACIDHMAASQWFPKVSELRDRATSMLIDELAMPTPAEAWGLVIDRMRLSPTVYRDGEHYRRKPLAPLIESAVHAVGGWSYLRTSENGMSDRKQFLDAYQAIALRERRRLTEHPAVAAAREQIAAREPVLEVGDGGE